MKKISSHFSQIPLRWKFVLLVAVCFITPVLIFSAVNGYVTDQSINTQILTKITDSIDENINNCINQINFEIYASRMATYNPAIWKAYSAYKDTDNYTSLLIDTQKFLSEQYRLDTKLKMAQLYFWDNPDELLCVTNIRSQTIFENIHHYRTFVHEEVTTISRDLDTKICFFSSDESIYLIRNLVDTRSRPFATLTLQLDPDEIFANMKSIAWCIDVAVQINDVYIPIKGEMSKEEFDKNTFLNSDSFSKRSIIHGQTVANDFMISYSVKFDNDSLNQGFSRYRWIISMTPLFILPLVFIIIRFFYTNVSDPTGKIVNVSQRIQEGEFGYKITEKLPNPEFQYLGNAINEMSDKLKDQFDKLYMEGIALRDAQIMFLQSQMNPHFLNNALEIINWQARLYGNEKVSNMIEALSTMMDSMLNRKSSTQVTLREEMAYVDAYLYIIAERFGKKLIIKKEIDERFQETILPKLSIQPIVENAVEYGIVPHRGGHISMRAYQNKGNFIFEVENTGAMSLDDERRIKKLLSEKQFKPNPDHTELGIKSVAIRLKVLYGGESGLVITKAESGHTVAKIIKDLSTEG